MAGKNRTAKAVAFCDFHRKLLYESRKVARSVARQHTSHKGPYRCTQQPTLWHIGEIATDVRRGHLSREQVYGDLA